MIFEAWPDQGAATARKQEMARDSEGGVCFSPPVFSLEGSQGLLARALAELPLSNGGQALLPQAGALLVQDILARESEQLGPLAALGRSWRLPSGLWRLLVEVKAAGLDPPALRALSGRHPRLGPLGLLLELYNQALAQGPLWDQADLLAEMEKRPDWLPPFLARATGLRLRRVLWLRTLDMRLLRILARSIPLEIEFLPQGGAESPVETLMAHTAASLSTAKVSREPLGAAATPLAGLARSLSRGGREKVDPPPGSLVLGRASGYYTEVEFLLDQAEKLLEQGVRPHEITLVFPSLRLYGQMVRDVAARRGLPISLSWADSLAGEPLGNDFLRLLALPQAGHPRESLEKIWQSPYLATSLSRLFGKALPPDPSQVLRESRYIDGRDTPPHIWLQRVSREAGDRFAALAGACQGLVERLAVFGREGPLGEFINHAVQLLNDLALSRAVDPALPDLAVRDLRALRALEGCLADLARAASQAGAQTPRSAGACLSLLKQAVGACSLQERPGGGGRGIQVLEFGETLAIAPRWLLFGGLVQGEFPLRPASRQLLSGPDRLALGRAAKMPVWRTDEEEYSGQILALCRLLAACGEGAVLSCPAADSLGRELEPAGALAAIKEMTSLALPAPKGGVFGEMPGLDQARDQSSLLFALCRDILGQGGDPLLATAVLDLWRQTPERARAWQWLAERAARELRRLDLNRAPLAERPGLADESDGRLISGPALGILARVLASPEARTLSATSLETYAACPYLWFLGRVLGLAAWEDPGWEVDPRQEGDWAHEALRLFFDPRETGGIGPPLWDPERFRDCLARAGRAKAGWQKAHPMLAEARFEPLFQRLSQVVRQEIEALQGWDILGVEMEMAQEPGLLAPLGDGEPLRIRGRLDRLERRGKELRVCDYKHTSNPSLPGQAVKVEEFGKSSFQIPLYLLAAQSLAPGPTEEFIGRVCPSKRQHGGPKEVILGLNDPLLAGEGGGPPGILAAVAGLWQRMLAGDFVAQPDKQQCAFCDWAGTCRATVSLGEE